MTSQTICSKFETFRSVNYIAALKKQIELIDEIYIIVFIMDAMDLSRSNLEGIQNLKYIRIKKRSAESVCNVVTKKISQLEI